MSFSVQNFNIHKYGQKFCLDDVVSQCNLSINPKEYIHKVTPKTLFNGNYYVTKTKLISILEKAKAIESKKLLELIKNNKDVKSTDLTNSIEHSETNQPNKSTHLTVKKPINFVDSGKNVIYFNGNQIKYFYFKQQIYFKAKDVANILEYVNSKQSIFNHIDNNDKITIKAIWGGLNFSLPLKSNEYIKINSLFGNEDPKTIFINESGLYSLILGSKKPEAKQFKHWVTSEVLPAIRKYGSYSLINGNEYSIDKLDKFKDNDVIYLLNVKDNLYKFGTSYNIKERLHQHANTLNYNHIVKIYSVSNRNIGLKCEDKIKKLAKKLKVNICYNNGIEFFETNNKYSIQDMINNIKEIIDETEIEYKQKNYTVPVPIDHLIEMNKLIETLFNGCNSLIKQQAKIQAHQNNINKDVELKIKELEINQKHQNLMEEKKMHYQIRLKELDFEMMKIKLELERIQNKPSVLQQLIDAKMIGNGKQNVDSVDLNITEECIEKTELGQKTTTTIAKIKNEPTNNVKTKLCIGCKCPINIKSTRCNNCNNNLKLKQSIESSNDKPTLAQLYTDLKQLGSYVQVGIKYGVSDNCIRKWINKRKKYNMLNL